MNKEQLIQDYIANRLSEKDKAIVGHLLKTDSDFKAELESHEEISMAFKISEADNLKAQFQRLEASPQNKNSFKKFKYVYLAIASVLVVSLFYNTFRSPSGNQLFNSNFDVYPNTYQPVVRSNTSNDNKGFVAYENGDYLTAEQEFANLLNASENLNISFYYAVSLLNQAKFEEALTEFKSLNTNTFDYNAESLWYSALIHIKNENYIKAKENLNEMNRLDFGFKSEERDVLLSELKNK